MVVLKDSLRNSVTKVCKMSRLMRKPTICVCENKDADQLRGVTAKLISAFVFATPMVHFLFFLHPKF